MGRHKESEQKEAESIIQCHALVICGYAVLIQIGLGSTQSFDNRFDQVLSQNCNPSQLLNIGETLRPATIFARVANQRKKIHSSILGI